MRVLGLCSYPTEAAATRFRMAQFVEPLRLRGIELTISAFLNSQQFSALYESGGAARKALRLIRPVMNRIGETLALGKYDLIIVQREAMIFGPGFFEWLYRAAGRVPMVLDLDDATYVRYVSPTYGRLGSFFKFFGKTDKLIDRSEVVICGNRFIAEYVNSRGKKSVIIPTVVDENIFRPIDKLNDVPVIGWIGTHSTFAFLESLFPVLTRLAAKHRFKLRIIGSGRRSVIVPGVEVENLEWRLDREAIDFASLDIGLYPIAASKSASEQWIAGKSGFKAIQYMAVGVPFVMSPVGVCGEMGEAGKTHFSADTPEGWYNSLDALLSDADLRTKMGSAGRKHAVENYDLESQADKLATVFRRVISLCSVD